MNRLLPFTLGIIGYTLSAASAAQVSDDTFESTHFSGSGNCGRCHDGISDQWGEDVSIRREWSATLMANSARDPYWLAKVASEIQRNPDLAAVIEDKCTRCHAPMANVQAQIDGAPPTLLGSGFVSPANPYHDAAMDGVSCTLCHQIEPDATLGTPEGTSGGFVIDAATPKPDRAAYGPYGGPRINPMRNESGFVPLESAHMADSALCGSCHDLRTPVFDSDGSLVSTGPEDEFPEQMIYSEWRHSDYGPGRPLEQSCQSCHMAQTDGVPLSFRPRSLQPRDDFHRHGFYGGNTRILALLDANRDRLDAPEADYAGAIEATRATLARAAEIALASASVEDGALVLRVRVTNRTGHKLPSGFPSRQVYIHLRVSDAEGRVVFESGGEDAQGGIVRRTVPMDPARTFEPHHGEITDADQVQIYESVMRDAAGDLTHTLLEAAGYLKDNRLLPAGFDNDSAPDAIAAKGLAASDADFVGGSDAVTYRLRVQAEGPLTVAARLRYQAISEADIDDLRRDAEGPEPVPEVVDFLRMLDALGPMAETIAETQVTLTDLPPLYPRANDPPGVAPGQEAPGSHSP